MEKKTCATCKYKNVLGMEEPCKSCGDISTSAEEINYSNWEPGPDNGENSRPKILPIVTPYYERNSSRIPEQIRVSFSDGSTAIYDLHTDQPAPVILENIKIIRRMKQGYVNQPMRRRRRK